MHRPARTGSFNSFTSIPELRLQEQATRTFETACICDSTCIVAAQGQVGWARLRCAYERFTEIKGGSNQGSLGEGMHFSLFRCRWRWRIFFIQVQGSFFVVHSSALYFDGGQRSWQGGSSTCHEYWRVFDQWWHCCLDVSCLTWSTILHYLTTYWSTYWVGNMWAQQYSKNTIKNPWRHTDLFGLLAGNLGVPCLLFLKCSFQAQM